jgi:hypothetical protein
VVSWQPFGVIGGRLRDITRDASRGHGAGHGRWRQRHRHPCRRSCGNGWNQRAGISAAVARSVSAGAPPSTRWAISNRKARPRPCFRLRVLEEKLLNGRLQAWYSLRPHPSASKATTGQVWLGESVSAAQHLMRCPSCMAANTETRRFCAQCGSALAVPCPTCGLENEAIASFAAVAGS